ncbi:MAG: TipJ family phage tail tip protein, partial [Candidatus Thorarchaeota archaeon]
MITIKYIPDIFTLEGRREWKVKPKVSEQPITVKDLDGGNLAQCGDVWIDGVIIPPEEFGNVPVGPCADVVIYRRPGMPWIIPFIPLILTIISIALTIASTVASILMAPDVPDMPGDSQNFKSNRNYGWGGVTTEYSAGTLVPIPYGRAFVGGKSISQRVHTGAKYNQRLDLLLLLGEGPIRGIRNENNTGICPWTRMRVQAAAAATTLEVDDTREMVVSSRIEVELDNGQMHESTIASITDHNTLVLDDEIPAGRNAPVDGYVFTYPDPYIKLDGNYIGNLKNTTWYFRPGTLDQPNISAFQDTYETFADSQELSYVDDDGNLEYYEVTNIGGVQGIDALELNFSFPYGLYAMDAETGDLISQDCKIRIQYKPHATSWAAATTIDKTWKSKKTGMTYRRIRLPQEQDTYFSNSQYDFRVVRMGPIRDTTRKKNTVFLHSYVLVNRNAFSYPGSALLAIKARASEQLSSSTPNALIYIDGRILQYYDGSSWQSETWD